jgi:Ca2+-binding RTX toxin-like protein
VRHSTGSVWRLRRGGVGRLAALVVAAPLLMLPVALDSYAFEAAAPKAPTCRGVPATIVGTPGDDDIAGTPGDDVIVGDRGNDSIRGQGGDDLICGGRTRSKDTEGDVVFQGLDGGPGDDTIIGGSGVDEIFGGTGSDLLVGRPGNDFISGSDNKDRVRGGPGADNLSGDGGDDDVYGGSGADFMSDVEGNNTLRGGPDDDVSESGPGNETIRGGRGRDAASYLLLQDPAGGSGSHCSDITADLSAGTASGDGFGTDTLDGIEKVWTGGGNDVLIGDEGPNEFYTGTLSCDETSPTDSVAGNGGLDRITFDSLNVETGNGPGPVEVDLQAKTALWGDPESEDRDLITLSSIEDVAGTEYEDVIFGDDGPNNLVGRDGDDLINGRGGDDQLLGHRGNDSLDGGLGANTNDGGPGTDTCVNPGPGALAVNCEH